MSGIPEEEPVVKVTLTSIYTKLLDMEKKIDPVPEIVKDLLERTRKLEIQVAIQWVGYGLLIAALVAQGVKLLFP